MSLSADDGRGWATGPVQVGPKGQPYVNGSSGSAPAVRWIANERLERWIPDLRPARRLGCADCGRSLDERNRQSRRPLRRSSRPITYGGLRRSRYDPPPKVGSDEVSN